MVHQVARRLQHSIKSMVVIPEDRPVHRGGLREGGICFFFEHGQTERWGWGLTERHERVWRSSGEALPHAATPNMAGWLWPLMVCRVTGIPVGFHH